MDGRGDGWMGEEGVDGRRWMGRRVEGRGNLPITFLSVSNLQENFRRSVIRSADSRIGLRERNKKQVVTKIIVGTEIRIRRDKK